VSEQHPAPDLTALADELRRLAPREPALDRDATLFRAGRASAPRGLLWPVATAVSSLTAGVLAAVLYLQPAPQTATVKEIVYIDPPTAVVESPSTEAPDDAEELPPHRRLHDHLLRWGLDGLTPAPPHLPTSPRSYSSYYSDLTKGDPTP
jgi:hypothetical protein